MSPPPKKQKTDSVAVSRFIEYLQIKTVQPNPDYSGCNEFLKKYAKELDIQFRVVEPFKGYPIQIMTIFGTDPSLKSLLLNSHTDVVPVQESLWDTPPFAAHRKSNGDIVARGSQDMKCVGIWYMEAFRKLINAGTKLKRTVHISWVPDEEIGGAKGMQAFCKHEEFKKLNVGFALDEGLANEEDSFMVYNGERSPWWMELKANGKAGHGSKFIEPNASIRLLRCLNHFIDFREEQKSKLANNINLALGDVTTCNINLLSAGVQLNCVHSEAIAGIDMRVSPLADFVALENQIKSWCEEEEIELTFKQKTEKIPVTKLDESTPQWKALLQVAEKHKVRLEPTIFPAATDSRFLRLMGIPCFGISAIKKHPVLLHDHNEYLNEKTLIDGVDFYADLITKLANL